MFVRGAVGVIVVVDFVFLIIIMDRGPFAFAEANDAVPLIIVPIFRRDFGLLLQRIAIVEDLACWDRFQRCYRRRIVAVEATI